MESSNAENISSALENVTELLVLYWLPKTEDSWQEFNWTDFLVSSMPVKCHFLYGFLIWPFPVSRPGNVYEVVSDINKKQPYLNINVTIYNLDSGLIQLP